MLFLYALEVKWVLLGQLCMDMYKTPKMCLVSFCIIQIKETEKIHRQPRQGMLYPNFSEPKDFQEHTMRSFQWWLVSCMVQGVSRDLHCQGLQIPSLSALTDRGLRVTSHFQRKWSRHLVCYRSARSPSSHGQTLNTGHEKTREWKSV